MITNNTCNGQCSCCGECCNPWNPITLDEYRTIKKYIKEHDIKPVPCRPDSNNNLYVTCPFNIGHGCSIYPVRPNVCKQFSCSSGKIIINKNIDFFDSHSDINGKHLDRFIPFDLLFFGDPTISIMTAYKKLHADNQDKLITTLKFLGGDQNFLKSHNLPNCYEIAEAMEKGYIQITWDD